MTARMMCYRCMQLTGENGYCTRCGAPIRTERDVGDDLLLPLGTRLDDGNIIVGEKLGKGGFGITYRALDTQQFGLIALKEFVPSFMIYGMRRNNAIYITEDKMADYQKYMSFFRNEATMMAGLDHPNIVRVYFDFEENNTCYYGMELLTGRSLQDWIDEKGPMNAMDAFRLIQPALDALEYLQRKGVLHRDLSPRNIFLRDAPGKFMNVDACLIDFGAAYDAKVAYSKSAPHIKTKGYSPPEQNAGHHIYGKYSDVYSMCAVLYFMVTGNVPLPAEDRALYGTELTAPHKLNPEIPKAFSDVLQRGMVVDYKHRIQEMYDLDVMLRRALKLPPPPPQPLSTVDVPSPTPSSPSRPEGGKSYESKKDSRRANTGEDRIQLPPIPPTPPTMPTPPIPLPPQPRSSGSAKPLLACIVDMLLFALCLMLVLVWEPARSVLNDSVPLAVLVVFAVALVGNSVACLVAGGTLGELVVRAEDRRMDGGRAVLHALTQTLYPYALFHGVAELAAGSPSASAGGSMIQNGESFVEDRRESTAYKTEVKSAKIDDRPSRAEARPQAYVTGYASRDKHGITQMGLKREGQVLGRWADQETQCDTPVSSSMIVSRKHCRIAKDGDWYVEDLNSKNGTFVNGRRIKPYDRNKLYDGYRLTLGEGGVELVFHANDKQ